MAVVDCEGTDFYVLSKDILARGASLRFRARGNSMRPFIQDGDMLSIEPIEASRVQIGDVILFGQGGRVLAHRAIKRHIENEGMLIVKGDSHLRPDRPVHPDQVLGKVTSIEREGELISLDRGVSKLAGVLLLLWGKAPFLGCRVYLLLGKAKRGALWIARRAKSLRKLGGVPFLAS